MTMTMRLKVAAAIALVTATPTTGFSAAFPPSHVRAQSDPRGESRRGVGAPPCATRPRLPPTALPSALAEPGLEVEDREALAALERAAAEVADASLDEACLVDQDTGGPADELCLDEGRHARAREQLTRLVRGTLRLVRGDDGAEADLAAEDSDGLFELSGGGGGGAADGEALERGWEARGNSSALRRNAEVWKFALKCVFRVLRARKLTKAGVDEDAVAAAKEEAATFIRDGLLRLGPTFVKLGQVVSTRTDVLAKEYIEVLKTLQDDVPGFTGKRAEEIVAKELNLKNGVSEVFEDFSPEPLAAASLGQVHTATYRGKKVAVKVQRAGLRELFSTDLKNLKKLAELLDKFDPKTDGADRNWVSIYEESERLLYLEIDYLNEAANCERFARDFRDIAWVRVPEVYREVSTEKVLTMEFVESFKLTNIQRIEELGLDRELLAKRSANAFLRQIVETGYFHCDPHPGNLCVDESGNLVYYDFGMMDELKPNIKSGFRKFCTALFAGGPVIGDIELAENAKRLIEGVEEAGVLASGADRLAVEKLARYYMRTFKDKQLGKKGSNIKETVGTDLQTLTENDVFRFPSTFTFIFRSFASIDGIGKGLSDKFDLGKLAQPFIETFTEVQRNETPAEKQLNVLAKATGLNRLDIEKAVTSPKKIAYIEETLREIERGDLKIRVRSLENEKALERMSLTQSKMEKLVVSSLLLNLVGVTTGILRGASVVGALAFALQTFVANSKISKFDKTQEKFVKTKFIDDE